MVRSTQWPTSGESISNSALSAASVKPSSPRSVTLKVFRAAPLTARVKRGGLGPDGPARRAHRMLTLPNEEEGAALHDEPDTGGHRRTQGNNARHMIMSEPLAMDGIVLCMARAEVPPSLLQPAQSSPGQGARRQHDVFPNRKGNGRPRTHGGRCRWHRSTCPTSHQTLQRALTGPCAPLWLRPRHPQSWSARLCACCLFARHGASGCERKESKSLWRSKKKFTRGRLHAICHPGRPWDDAIR